MGLKKNIYIFVKREFIYIRITRTHKIPITLPSQRVHTTSGKFVERICHLSLATNRLQYLHAPSPSASISFYPTYPHTLTQTPLPYLTTYLSFTRFSYLKNIQTKIILFQHCGKMCDSLITKKKSSYLSNSLAILAGAQGKV